MSKRYVKFNRDALVKIAVKAVSARSCTSFKKISEGSPFPPEYPIVRFGLHGTQGMFNRVFLLGFDTGAEVIARLPFPIVGSPHLVTASEVATMDFARIVLKIPVPRVLAWSSHPNDVGTEFILCEKAPGVEMKQVWTNTRYQDFANLTHISDAIYDIEKEFISRQFSSYGSIFYKRDLEGLPHSKHLWADGRKDDASERFAIGPMMIWDLWRGERSTMEIDRGPCVSGFTTFALDRPHFISRVRSSIFRRRFGKVWTGVDPQIRRTPTSGRPLLPIRGRQFPEETYQGARYISRCFGTLGPRWTICSTHVVAH